MPDGSALRNSHSRRNQTICVNWTAGQEREERLDFPGGHGEDGSASPGKKQRKISLYNATEAQWA